MGQSTPCCIRREGVTCSGACIPLDVDVWLTPLAAFSKLLPPDAAPFTQGEVVVPAAALRAWSWQARAHPVKRGPCKLSNHEPGHISMQQQSTPAALFQDPMLEGERVLHELEALHPDALFDTLVAAAFAGAVGRLSCCGGAAVAPVARLLQRFHG